jgi:Leucine-rich repeat (LRR) protein
MRRNPGFDGKVEHKIEDGVVTELRIATDQVTDIAPIRVFNALRVLDLSGTHINYKGNGQLADLSPLTGMNLGGLTRLKLSFTMVGDAGMAHFEDCKKLTYLGLDGTRVSDTGLTNFKDCTNLTYLYLGRTKVTDAGLAHFKGCKNLTKLDLSETPVGDAGLGNFKDCENLTVLAMYRTRVTDLSLLKGMSLKELGCDFRPDRDAEILRSIKTLERINGKPAAEFWKRYDKGEFK